jgi:hypothetical protein
VEVTADPFDDTLESPDVEEKGSDVTWRDIGPSTNLVNPNRFSYPVLVTGPRENSNFLTISYS